MIKDARCIYCDSLIEIKENWLPDCWGIVPCKVCSANKQNKGDCSEQINT